jgi:hypothetical protein
VEVVGKSSKILEESESSAIDFPWVAGSDRVPTVLKERGWRLFFYSNEGQEPIHIHGRKGDAESKYWLRTGAGEIEEAWSFNLTPRLHRELREIIIDHFELIIETWNRHFGGQADGNG